MRFASHPETSPPPHRDLVARLEPLPAFAQAVAAVIVVSAIGIVPLTLLDELGLARTPRVPWVAPVAALWVWLVWRFLNRPGWRQNHLCARPLAPSHWALALTALIVGTLVIHAARIALLNWTASPDVRLPDVSRYSVGVILSSFLVTALSAGIFEEAGYRGYLQSVLIERYGTACAVTLSAALFALTHITRGRAFLPVLPLAFLFGCVYGVVALRTGSIWPGIIVHSGYNLARLLYLWLASPFS